MRSSKDASFTAIHHMTLKSFTTKDSESKGKLISESLSFTMQSVSMAVLIQYITYDTIPNCDILPPRGVDTSCKQAAHNRSSWPNHFEYNIHMTHSYKYVGSSVMEPQYHI